MAVLGFVGTNSRTEDGYVSYLGQSPTPWRAEPTRILAAVEGAQLTPVPWRILTTSGKELAIVVDLEEAQANAFLIAAAYDLYDAVTDALELSTRLPETVRGDPKVARSLRNFETKANAALAKARGESS